MNVIFMGTPDFSVPILNSLVAHGINVVLVVTQPDKEVGRGRKVTPTPVKVCAMEHDIAVFAPDNINEHVEIFKQLDCDLIITCAYGQILSQSILDCAKIMPINIHASLLPSHRGGAPIHRAILEGDEFSGISIMRMVKKMDAGEVFLQEKVKITSHDTFGSLHNKLAVIGSRLIIEAIPEIVNQTNLGVVQDESRVTYSPNIDKSECYLNFAKLGSKKLDLQVRAFNPFPSSFVKYEDAIVKIYELKILETVSDSVPGTIISISKNGIEVSTLDFNVLITKLQVPGKKMMNAADFYNGNKFIKENTIFY